MPWQDGPGKKLNTKEGTGHLLLVIPSAPGAHCSIMNSLALCSHLRLWLGTKITSHWNWHVTVWNGFCWPLELMVTPGALPTKAEEHYFIPSEASLTPKFFLASKTPCNSWSFPHRFSSLLQQELPYFTAHHKFSNLCDDTLAKNVFSRTQCLATKGIGRLLASHSSREIRNYCSVLHFRTQFFSYNLSFLGIINHSCKHFWKLLHRTKRGQS